MIKIEMISQIQNSISFSNKVTQPSSFYLSLLVVSNQMKIIFLPRSRMELLSRNLIQFRFQKVKSVDVFLNQSVQLRVHYSFKGYPKLRVHFPFQDIIHVTNFMIPNKLCTQPLFSLLKQYLQTGESQSEFVVWDKGSIMRLTTIREPFAYIKL